MATPLPLQHCRSPFLSPLPRIKPKTFSQTPNPNARLARFTILCTSPSSSSSWEREEARWLREEQRWLREEQRWMREEARWREERERLLDEIGMLRLKLEMMEKERLTDAEAVVTRPRPVLVENAAVKEMLLEETVKVEEEVKDVREVGVEQKREPEKKEKKKKRSLRVGTEGDDVCALQEALQKLGFYCGEEDMEFSSFSSGTERAVKTWQATLGTQEDGIMTEELLEMLFSDRKPSNAHEGGNGAAVASVVAQVAAEIEKTVVKESSASNSGVEVSQHRVFLLGENRWEEPSRLKNNKQVIKNSGLTSGTKCRTCRGEGRLMCTECDGTGEPNIEPQFLEWVDEGTKCPYCEGLGYTICDVCDGKTVVQN